MKLFTNTDVDSAPADDVLQTTLGMKIKLRRYYYNVTLPPWILILSAKCQAPLSKKEKIEVEMCRDNL